MKNNQGIDIDELYDFQTGRQRRLIYHDDDIYQKELENIFARCWLFLAHDSQLQKPGDFIRTYMGEDYEFLFLIVIKSTILTGR